MVAQTIQIDSLFTTDGEIFPFGPNDTIYGLSISGSVALLSDTSLVRVILTDNSGQNWMVYEAYPMIVTDTASDFEHECDETCFLNTFIPYSLNIQIIDASLELSFLNAETESKGNIDALQYQVKREKDVEKVQMINYNIHKRGWNWTAGDNELISKYYFEKSVVFTNNKYNLQGFDYYSGGVFKYVSFHENVPNPSVRVKIEGHTSFDAIHYGVDDFKKKLMTAGPQSVEISSMGHVMSLIGYEVDENDITHWIFKNSILYDR